jgi:FAD binding domain/Berberine and berberine like
LGWAGSLALGAGAAGALSGFRFDLTSGIFHELARELQGTVVTPSRAAYQRDKLLVNSRFDGSRPWAIVYCKSSEDVERTIHWARKHAIRIVPRCGGHSYGGYSTTSAGVVVDVTRMNKIHVSGGKATVGAGARLIDVYAGLAKHGLTIPAGSCPSVGIAGLTLGGGVGFAGRKLGLTSDNLVELSLVSARGKLLACGPREHADLYWACRGGGGGNFGIATSFRFRTHPAPDVAYYEITWPWSDAGAVVRAWQEFAPHAPDDLFSTLFMATTAPKDGTRKPVVSSGGQFFGTEAELHSLIASLAATGTPTRVTVGTLSYLDAVLHWAGCHPFNQCHAVRRFRFKGKSDYVNAPLSKEAIATLLRALEANQADGSLGRGELILDAYGGAINRVPKAETAFVHRSSLFSIQHFSTWTGKGTEDVRWLRDLYAAMRPYVSGFAYQNYLDPDLHSWKHAYYGSNLRRLAHVKRTHDPHNFFHFPQSIPRHV